MLTKKIITTTVLFVLWTGIGVLVNYNVAILLALASIYVEIKEDEVIIEGRPINLNE